MPTKHIYCVSTLLPEVNYWSPECFSLPMSTFFYFFLFGCRREFVTFCNKDSRTCRATSFLVVWHSLVSWCSSEKLQWEINSPPGDYLFLCASIFHTPLSFSLPVPVTQTPNTLPSNKDPLWHDLVRRVWKHTSSSGSKLYLLSHGRGADWITVLFLRLLEEIQQEHVLPMHINCIAQNTLVVLPRCIYTFKNTF